MDSVFWQDSVNKDLIIEYDGGTLVNDNFKSESFTLTESLCSQSILTFGSCEASAMSLTIINTVAPLVSKELSVSMRLQGLDSPVEIGKYKVFSDKPTADRRYREITAYDAMYDIINADVSDWYNDLLPDMESSVTLKEFRDSFLAHFGIDQEEATLCNDDMVVQKTVDPSELSGKTVINAICEINGCFGHINRQGRFEYKFLKEIVSGLYPSNDLYPEDNLYPQDNSTKLIATSYYKSCKYEDYTCQKITKLQIRQEENDIGSIVGTGANTYIIQDNFLVYGKGAEELAQIAQNVFDVIKIVSYQPFEAEVKGNPLIEVGEAKGSTRTVQSLKATSLTAF